MLDYKNLVYKITTYFSGYQNKDDLFQAGVVGLLTAYQNFDPSYNIKFTTYAYPYIMGEMKKLVREDKSIKISREITKLNARIEVARNVLCQRLSKEPTNYELARFLEIDEYIVAEAQNSLHPIRSIDEPISIDSKEQNLHDVIPDYEPDIDALITLKDELGKLTPVELELLQKRYFVDMTQTQTAQALGMSQVQVSRQEQKVLTKLRKRLDQV